MRGAFSKPNPMPGKGPAWHLYPPHTGVAVNLRDGARALGISPFRLSRLLGCASDAQLYQWLSGQYRPSPLYVHRLCRLLLLRLEGYEFADPADPKTIKHIDWASEPFGTGVPRRNVPQGAPAA